MIESDTKNILNVLTNARLTGFILYQLRPGLRMEIFMLMAKAVYCFGIIAALRISPGM